MNKMVILLWKGKTYEYWKIETDTNLHEDRPTKLIRPLEGSNKVIVNFQFTLSGNSGPYWVYTQD